MKTTIELYFNKQLTMRKSWHFILLFFALLQTATLAAQERYTVKPGDPNGIRKWYMGRQIAHVMSHFGIEWLERKEREMEENTSQLLKNLAVQPGTAMRILVLEVDSIAPCYQKWWGAVKCMRWMWSQK